MFLFNSAADTRATPASLSRSAGFQVTDVVHVHSDVCSAQILVVISEAFLATTAWGRLVTLPITGGKLTGLPFAGYAFSSVKGDGALGSSASSVRLLLTLGFTRSRWSRRPFMDAVRNLRLPGPSALHPFTSCNAHPCPTNSTTASSATSPSAPSSSRSSRSSRACTTRSSSATAGSASTATSARPSSDDHLQPRTNSHRHYELRKKLSRRNFMSPLPLPS